MDHDVNKMHWIKTNQDLKKYTIYHIYHKPTQNSYFIATYESDLQSEFEQFNLPNHGQSYFNKQTIQSLKRMKFDSNQIPIYTEQSELHWEAKLFTKGSKLVADQIHRKLKNLQSAEIQHRSTRTIEKLKAKSSNSPQDVKLTSYMLPRVKPKPQVLQPDIMQTKNTNPIAEF